MESANVVGYQTKELTDNFNFIVNTFKPVGSESATMKLSDIVPTGTTIGGTILSLLDDGGATAMVSDVEDLGEVYAEFYYLDAASAATYKLTPGWYLSEDSDFAYCQNDREIRLGQGYMVDNQDGDVSLTFSGEVNKEDIPLDIIDNFNFTGNATPSIAKLGDYVPTGTTIGGTILALLDDGGATAMVTDVEDLGDVYAEFYYLDPTSAATFRLTPGWYLSDDSDFAYCQNDREIAPGAGFMIDNQDGEIALSIPTALPSAE